MSEINAHTPVLADEVCELLNVRPGEIVVDATVGLGGHSLLLGGRLRPEGMLIGLDVDPGNLQIARERLRVLCCRVELVHANFAELSDALQSVGVDQVDVLVADLGVSSNQLDEGQRGFSFQNDGPLDMRMDSRLTVTAATLVNRLKERDLADLIYYKSQDESSRKIARRICEARRESRITTTGRLARIVSEAVGVDPRSRKAKIHPATRTFLALRIAVNKEIECLESLLATAPNVLKTGGRIGIIAFHSVEDRPVKRDFRERKKEGLYQILTKRPVIAGDEERQRNPRSRSAKLRVAVRV